MFCEDYKEKNKNCCDNNCIVLPVPTSEEEYGLGLDDEYTGVYLCLTCGKTKLMKNIKHQNRLCIS